MPLLNLFKKKKKKPSVKAVKKEPSIKQVSKKDFSQAVTRSLVSPHITEKATDLGKENKYVFKVKRKANKVEIKKAIQELYGVRVMDVKIINIPRKPRRLGRTEGYKSGYKKAIATLVEGEKIELIPK